MSKNRQAQNMQQQSGRDRQSAQQPPESFETRGGERGSRLTQGRQPGNYQIRMRRGGLSSNPKSLARGLGVFSLGLGLAQVVAPRQIAKLVGVQGDRNGLIRLLGIREIGHGIGILTQRWPAEAVWSRVAGDAIDLAVLGGALASTRANRGKVAAATAAVLGVTALDVITAQQLSSKADGRTARGGIHVQKSIVINRKPEELYQFWHNFENLPRFMYHLESVQRTGDRRSHWVAKAPAGATVEWDAETTDDRPNELISWRSLEGADVDNWGVIRFEPAPGGRGTIVRVEMEYNPPGGILGATVAKLFGEEAGQQIQDDLRRFKQLIETGEVVQSDASIHGEPHPAQPPARARGAASGRR
jgi:uncharacterized membrane protein